MLRVRETATAELLTNQLPKVEVSATSLVSGATDSSDPNASTTFTSNTQDRISTANVPMIEPAHVIGLPKGQAFGLLEGGMLWKIRIPLPSPESDESMPRDLRALADNMRQRYTDAPDWWRGPSQAHNEDRPLPDDLLMGAGPATAGVMDAQENA